jgi:hypothetical protein
MSKNNKNLLKSTLSNSKFRFLVIELKIELRKLKIKFNNLHLAHHLKKFYLVFLIAACIIPLQSINPSAQNDNKLMQISSQLQIVNNANQVYAQPHDITPELALNFKSNLYSVYKLQKNENIDTLIARLGNLNKDTILINNPNKEFIEGKDILLPLSNGLLLGFNKDSNIKEMAEALKKSEDDLNKQKNGLNEGYFFFNSDEPSKLKKEFDDNIIRIRTPKVDSKPIQVNSVVSASSFPASDFSSALAGFINQTKGISQHDGNGWSPGQCVSLVKRWQQYIGAKSGYWPGNYPAPSYYAYLAGNKSMAPDVPSYKIVVVTDVNSMKAGDLLITTGVPSHTGIATGRVGGGTFDIYDQNSPFNSPPRFNTYPTRMFIGALRYIKA